MKPYIVFRVLLGSCIRHVYILGYILVNQVYMLRNILDFTGRYLAIQSYVTIFIIYMGSGQAIYNDIATSTSVFFLGQKLPRAQIAALGNFLPRKKSLVLGAISLYIALPDPIYTLHIYHFSGNIPSKIY